MGKIEDKSSEKHQANLVELKSYIFTSAGNVERPKSWQDLEIAAGPETTSEEDETLASLNQRRQSRIDTDSIGRRFPGRVLMTPKTHSIGPRLGKRP
jgi:hypothetical protein